MRVVDPARATTTGGATRTMTARLVALRPGAPDLIDAAFLVALTMVAMLGFVSTFDSPLFLGVALAGVVLGILLAHLTNVLRWHWLLVVPVAALAYLAGGIPTARTGAVDVARLAVDGWKDMLTVLPPLPGDSKYVVLPYLLSVVVGTFGFASARRTRRPWPAIVAPTLLVAGVILLGTLRPAAAVPVGLGFAVLAFGWLAVRAARSRRAINTGRRSAVAVVMGGSVLVLALAGGFLLGPMLPGVDPSSRLVLRSYVEPPVQLPSLVSPLAGFRKYSSKKLPPAYSYNDATLLTVTDVQGTGDVWVRMAVMDDYSGTSWTATAGGGGLASTGFQRIGSQVPDPPDGAVVSAVLTVSDTFAKINDLKYWLPSLGQSTAITFQGPDAAMHVNQLRYNISTGQGLVPDALQAGDAIAEAAVPVDRLVLSGPPASPSGQPLVTRPEMDFIAGGIHRILPNDSLSPWDQLKTAADYLKTNGYWSDGTSTGEQAFLPGTDEARLVKFLQKYSNPIGSDEQYAGAMALIANWIGYPARVVMGAKVPADGVIKGDNVQAWVEVRTDDGRWHQLAPDDFIPSRDKAPQKLEQPPEEKLSAPNVPPPVPVRPPGAIDSQFESMPHTIVSGDEWLANIIATVLLVLTWVGPPIALILLIVGLIVGLKARRSARRRKKGSPARRIAGGWRDIVDVARDMGYVVPLAGTRREQTFAIGRGDLVGLSSAADAAIFGPGEVASETASGYWKQVRGTRKTMLRSVKLLRRWRARLNLRSLLPDNARLPSARPVAAARSLLARPDAARMRTMFARHGDGLAISGANLEPADVQAEVDGRTVRR